MPLRIDRTDPSPVYSAEAWEHAETGALQVLASHGSVLESLAPGEAAAAVIDADFFDPLPQVVALGGARDRGGPGALTALAGAVAATLGGVSDRPRAGGFEVQAARVLPVFTRLTSSRHAGRRLGLIDRAPVVARELAPFTRLTSSRHGGQRLGPINRGAPGAQTATLGGCADRPRAGGWSVAAGAATVVLGNTRSRERTGGFAAADASLVRALAPFTRLTSSRHAGRRMGPVGRAPAVALGGLAQRERAGTWAAVPGAVVISLGGTAERPRPGGFAAQHTVDRTGLPQFSRSKGDGSAVRLNGVWFRGGIPAQTASLGGCAERQRPGGFAAVAGVLLVGLGGSRERPRPGGWVAQPGAAQIVLGNRAVRERTGGLQALLNTAVLELGGVRERERAGGWSAVAVGAGVALGGRTERELAGGLTAYFVVAPGLGSGTGYGPRPAATGPRPMNTQLGVRSNAQTGTR